MANDLLSLIRTSGAADYASIAGVAISIFGFGATLFGIAKAKGAALAAKTAAEATGQKIQLLETIIDFSAAIALLEEVKRLHREQTPARILLDRYSAIRKLLVLLRSAPMHGKDEYAGKVQNVFVDIKEIEARVERSIQTKASVDFLKFNTLISSNIDELLEVLIRLKADNSRGEA